MMLRQLNAFFLLSLLLLFALPARSDAPDECLREPLGLRDSEIVTIRATGDIVIGTDFPVSHYPPGFEARLENTLRGTLGRADVIFGNFEGALTTHNRSPKTGSGSPYVFAFRMPPHFAPLLRRAGFGILNVANNHSYDFGEKGFNDTLAHLAQAGIETIGEQDKIVVMRIKGVRVAWVGFNYSIRHNDMHDGPRLEKLVREARAKADLVVVSIQAGAEGNEALRVVDREEIFLGERRGNVFAFARRAVDLGADLVVGHGPHVLRGMECYKGKLIAYSLGNFVGYNALSIKRAAAISAVLEVRLGRNGHTLGYDIIPVRFNDERLPEVDREQLARYLINDLSRLSPLNSTVQLLVPEEGRARYRAWAQEAGIASQLVERKKAGPTKRERPAATKQKTTAN
jgi:poly-gamma-glutamate capsule biosynthesis protein CapA/YwtB (metallophosphatase superfamily)